LRKAGEGVIAATTEMQAELWGRFKTKSHVICEVGSPGITTENPRQRGKQEALRVCWAGESLPGKALHLLLYAVASMPKNIDYSIEILGDGPCNKTWRLLANQLGIESRCHWHGWLTRDQSLSVMSHSHVCAITSLKDLTSSVAVEAISLGLPVVSLNHCGFADLVTKDCGVKIHPGSARQITDGFAEALMMLYHDEELRERLAWGAIRRSRAYLWEAKMETLDKIYQMTLVGNGSLYTDV
jgi:glycosyltransferase involved in cell wall biosynthesis